MPSATAGPGVQRTAHFTVLASDPTTLTGINVTGTKPFPLS
jgi:hypothetical protein